jgi:hypothetical protein
MNPFHCIGLVVLYLTTVFVVSRLSKWKNAPLFNAKWLAMFHNLFCTLLSLYMMVEIWRQAYLGGYNIFSQSLDRTSAGIPMASVMWLFYASKVPEFLDTILMAIKPNCRQITFLHVYHHSSIFLIWWIIVSYVPGGSSYFSAGLNSFVHVVMYGYYLWSSVAPKLPEGAKPRWNQPGFYRKYITQFQLIQFCLNFIQASYMLFVSPPADFPLFNVWILFYYMISMLFLFGNFFVKQYMQKGKDKRAAKIAASNSNGNGVTNGKETKKGL